MIFFILYFYKKIWASALVIGQLCDEPHHWNKKQTLSEWLQKEGIPGIEGIDTRQLTKILREKGTMRGKIVIEGDEEKNVDFVDPSKFNLVKEVSVKVEINITVWPQKI